MPFYEYECSSCGNALEVMQQMSDAPLTDCPKCGEKALKKLISAAGFRLGGKGWYETDFKSDGNKKNLKESSGGGESSSGGGCGGSCACG